MKKYICQFCGKSTKDVDYDYLVGYDHLVCVLNDMPDIPAKSKKKKPMEIKNWTKLSGQKFDVMGASFVIMDTSEPGLSNGTIYSAWIYPWNDDEAFLRVTLFTNDMNLQIKVLPPGQFSHPPIDLTTTINKVHLSNPSIFIQTIAEGLLDDPTVRNMIEFIGRKQDENKRTKGTGYSPGPGLSGSSGNNLW